MSNMPDRPDTWAAVLEWLSQHKATLYVALMSCGMAVLRVIHGGGKWREWLLEGPLCAGMTLGMIPLLEYFELPPSLALPVGVWVGYLGTKKIARLVDRFADFKLPNRPVD